MAVTIIVKGEKAPIARRLDTAAERAQQQGVDTDRAFEAVREAGDRARAESGHRRYVHGIGPGRKR